MINPKLRPLDWVCNIILYCLGAAMIFPFIWMVSTSFKLPQHVLAWPPSILPPIFTFTNYVAVFEKVDMLRYFFNTIRFTLVSAVCIVFTSALTGYVFAKYRFRFKETIFYCIIATMMVPFQCYMVPLYMLMVKLNAVDTYLGLQLPYLVQAFGTFFMRQNFESLPDEYLEAARLEGASEWKIFFSIALPSFRAAIGGLSIFIVASTWGNLIWPLIITSSERNFVLEMGLTNFQQLFTVEYGQFTAAATVATVPIIIFFIVFRRQIMEGITLSGIK
jgi:multiple sugar transport system permease protein